MKKRFLAVVLAFGFVFLAGVCYCETPFEKGKAEFKDENYEEALASFLEARKLEPSSSTVAYYLGLTYKILESNKEAVTYLREAVTLTPRVREALVELVDALYQTNEIGEAKKWIEVGEKENIEPARLQFLKGLVLVKEEKYEEAIKAFEKAKSLDAKLGQPSEFQIANAYVKLGKLGDARTRFNAVNRLDPNTDIATYARDYEKIVAEKMEREKPWRFTFGLAYKYDTNVVAKGSGPIADEISGERDSAMNFSARIGYTAPFSFTTPFNLSLQYSLYAERYFKKSYTRADGTTGNLSEYNNMTNTFSATPGYNFDRFSVSLPVAYGYSSLQGDKSNDFLNQLSWYNETRYMQYLNASPTLRILISQNQIGEVSVGYMKKKYFRTELHPAPIDPAEDRDSQIWSGSISWTYFFNQGKGLFGLRYTRAHEDADGDNWSNRENRFGFTFLCPVVGKLKAQVTAEAAFAEYVHTHKVFDIARRNETYTGTLGLIYEIFKNTDLLAQYTYIKDRSNIALYDYKREVWMLGLEYRY